MKKVFRFVRKAYAFVKKVVVSAATFVADVATTVYETVVAATSTTVEVVVETVSTVIETVVETVSAAAVAVAATAKSVAIEIALWVLLNGSCYVVFPALNVYNKFLKLVVRFQKWLKRKLRRAPAPIKWIWNTLVVFLIEKIYFLFVYGTKSKVLKFILKWLKRLLGVSTRMGILVMLLLIVAIPVAVWLAYDSVFYKSTEVVKPVETVAPVVYLLPAPLFSKEDMSVVESYKEAAWIKLLLTTPALSGETFAGLEDVDQCSVLLFAALISVMDYRTPEGIYAALSSEEESASHVSQIPAFLAFVSMAKAYCKLVNNGNPVLTLEEVSFLMKKATPAAKAYLQGKLFTSGSTVEKANFSKYYWELVRKFK